ncbi:beta-ketoacyl synthase N-terminal-like domain-containing protein [Amycolatopsis anabasis]|uniref:beta-ketoacyl synthase N-terminal-like domain-containing protein n=1 Tax=Amycolatopsis anabasis TaxID=1840409 RepID=UPI00131CDED8|nr:beta-ketoacyl synthase N-terminal-like domain-containing protein [Amycolatopsis anabasis]
MTMDVDTGNPAGPGDGDQTRELLSRAVRSVRRARRDLAEERDRRREPIAVVGMACRFPGGAESPEGFWQLLLDGREGVVDIPSDRWDVDEYYAPPPGEFGKIYVRQGNFVTRDVAAFDAAFFKISPAEARAMDPQQRQLLEVTWRALEHAGINPECLRGTSTGVFMGVSSANEYGLLPRDTAHVNQYNGTGTAASVASGRIAYVLGLGGPALTIDTACSSSLVSTLLAVRSLRERETGVALAGGVSLMLAPEVMSTLCSMNAVAADGRSRPFADGGSGYGRGEGVGVLVLKRLSDAQRDGDHVWATILGGAMNNDGASAGLTVPNRSAQRSVLADALAAARVAPEDVGVLETHGTGTPLGDPIEMSAIGDVLGNAARESPLLLGAVKGNIGHLETAAGVAGLIKSVLALHHGVVPGMVTSGALNPRVDLDAVPAAIPRTPVPWPRRPDLPGGRAVAGVSSFGFSGTNAHVILGAAPVPTATRPPATDTGPYALCLSAKDSAALVRMMRELAACLSANPALPAADVAYTINVRRPAFMHRAVVVGSTTAELAERLAAACADLGDADEIPEAGAGVLPGTMAEARVEAAGGTYRAGFQRSPVRRLGGADGVLVSKVADRVRPKLVYAFGASADGLAAAVASLAAWHPAFARRYDEVLALAGDAAPDGAEPVAEAAADVRLLAAQCALAEALIDWGVAPEVCCGDGVGELAAAVVTESLPIDVAVRLVVARATGASIGAGIVLGAGRPDRRFAGLGDGSPTAGDWARWARGETPRAARTLRDEGYRHVVTFGAETPLAAGDEMVPVGVLDASGARVLVSVLARLTALGIDVDWAAHHATHDGEIPPPPVVLPGYPFAGTRFWLPGPSTESLARSGVARLPRHGLDYEPVDLPTGPRQYRFVFASRNFPELADNSGVVHMGYFVEMLLRVLRDDPPGAVVFEDMEFFSPLIVVGDEERDVLLSVDEARVGGCAFRFFSMDRSAGGWSEHVRGTVGAAGDPGDVKLPEAGGTPRLLDAAAFYEPVEARGFVFGPAVRWVTSAEVTDGWARVEFLRDGDISGLIEVEHALGYHPGVLDSCAQTVNHLALGLGDDETKFMIRRLGRVVVTREEPAAEQTGEPGGTGPLAAVVTLDGETSSASVVHGTAHVLDGTGRPVLVMTDVELREFDGRKLMDMRAVMQAAGSRRGEKALLARYAAAEGPERIALVEGETLRLLAEELESDIVKLDAEDLLEDLGFDSLVGLRLFNRLREVFGIDLDLKDVVGAESPRALGLAALSKLPGGAELAAAAGAVPVAQPVLTGAALWIRGGERLGELAAKVRLICFPHGFGSADMYDGWQEALGDEVEVCPVKLPGLDVQRLHEPHPDDIDDVVEAFEEVLVSEGLLDKPVAVFGHSWGSLFAYRLAARLTANRGCLLDRLLVSGYTSPSLPNTSTMEIVEELAKIGFSGIPTYDEVAAIGNQAEVISAFVAAWGHEAAFVDTAVQGAELTLPTMLSAYRLVDRCGVERSTPLEVPIVGFHGLDDNRVSLSDMRAWGDVTHAGFKLVTVPGDHSFIEEYQSASTVREAIRAELTG